MAIIFKGLSRCSICNKILHETEIIIGWQAFLSKEHKLWKYSDSGMHKQCFNSWEHKKEFEFLYEYQPLFNPNENEIKKLIEEHGVPDWVKKILEFREKNGKD